MNTHSPDLPGAPGQPTGQVSVTCSACPWGLPPGLHGPGTPTRPGAADYIDWAVPHIGSHAHGTGHPVLVTIDTFTTGETSVVRIARPAGTTTVTTTAGTHTGGE